VGAVPVVMVLRLSLFDTNYISYTYVGLRNYVEIFMEPAYWERLYTSFLYTAILVPAGLIVSTVVSLYVINMKKWVQNYVRFVVYIPIFAAGIIMSTVWRYIFHARYGLLNWLIGLMGIEPVIWLGSKYTAMIGICTAILVCSIGFQVVVLVASMLSVTNEIFDAARIDGASWWQIKLRILLPMQIPTISLMAMLSMIGTMQIWETIYMMTGGGPMDSTANLMYDVYQTGFLYSRYGLASAKTIVLMLLILGMTLVKQRLEKTK
jgi:ABC-type sugar transport system permease subunit